MTGASNLEINILYFASLGERVGQERESFLLPKENVSVSELKSLLSARGDSWQEQLAAPSLNCAINQNLADNDAIIAGGDEVAFFPPVTGG